MLIFPNFLPLFFNKKAIENQWLIIYFERNIEFIVLVIWETLVTSIA
jgi:hypothetical protein